MTVSIDPEVSALGDKQTVAYDSVLGSSWARFLDSVTRQAGAVWLLLRVRSRAEAKYAGLRVLRR